MKVEICKSAQSAHQADGSSPIKVICETKLSFTHGHVFQFEALVVENLDDYPRGWLVLHIWVF